MSVLKIRNKKGDWEDVPAIKGDKGEDGNSAPHASRHAIGGEDAITPADIGAAGIGHTHSPYEIGAASISHNYTHAKDGIDPIAPYDIGAAEAEHNHDDRYYTSSDVDRLLAQKAPSYAWDTLDLEAGVSPLGTGRLFFVYE